MGVDFIRKTTHSFHKGLDRKRIELGTPDLFTQQPATVSRTYAANVREGVIVKIGDELIVRFDGEQVIAFRGLDPVATFIELPAEPVKALIASHGVACGVIQQVHAVARTVELNLS